MDAVTYVKERRRICESHNHCSNCPLHEFDDCEHGDPEGLVGAVEEWSKKHPPKTNGMKFLNEHRDHIRTYNRWENGCKPYIEVHIEADWWDAEYKGEWHE